MDFDSLPQRIAQRLAVVARTLCEIFHFAALKLRHGSRRARVCPPGWICSMCSEWPVGDFCMKARFSVSQAPCDEVDANPKLLGGLNLSLHNDFLGRWRWSCGAYTAMLNSCSF